MTTEDRKKYIRTMFAEVLENQNASIETYEKYFAKDYIQHVDGKTINYAQFVAHMTALKSSVQNIRVDFKRIIAENNNIISIHHVHATKQDGNQIEAKVIAHFQLRDDKIILCDELTHLLKGEHADKDLGSRH